MKKQYIHYKKRATLGVSVKLRNDYADYDYLNLLSNKDLNWLKGFNREFVNADFKHKYKKLHKKKKQVLLIYQSNNEKNRDIYNILKWTNNLYLGSHICETTNNCTNNLEDILNEFIDLKNNIA